MKQDEEAYIIFEDIIGAYSAERSLNGQYIGDIDVKIFLDWCSNPRDLNSCNGRNKLNYRREMNPQDVINMWNKQKLTLSKSLIPTKQSDLNMTMMMMNVKIMNNNIDSNYVY